MNAVKFFLGQICGFLVLYFVFGITTFAGFVKYFLLMWGSVIFLGFSGLFIGTIYLMIKEKYKKPITD